MYGDFSRDSHDRCRNYTRVLMQQGRPLTDADWNEQASIQSRQHAELLCALLGGLRHATFDGGFAPVIVSNKFVKLQPGSYVIDGITCYLPVYSESVFQDKDAARIDTSLKKLLATPEHAGKLALTLEAWEQAVNPAMDQ